MSQVSMLIKQDPFLMAISCCTFAIVVHIA